MLPNGAILPLQRAMLAASLLVSRAKLKHALASIMIWWVTMLALGPHTLLVHIIVTASSISIRMASARSLGSLIVNRFVLSDSHRNHPKELAHIHMSVIHRCRVRWVCLEVPRRLF